jgi:hypothetical protein
LLGVVLEGVLLELVLEHEGGVAEFAAVGVEAVLEPLVLAEALALLEGGLAQVARVRPQPLVQLQVAPQHEARAVPLAAERALVRRRAQRVLAPVAAQAGGVRERLAAGGARQRPLARVRHHVLGEVRPRVGAPTAHPAPRRPRRGRMRLQVLRQVVAERETLSAHLSTPSQFFLLKVFICY